MKRMVIGGCLLGVVACGDPSSSPTALRPGPCSSIDLAENQQSCTMTYEADRIVAITCTYPVFEQLGYTYQDSIDWSFEWDGDRLAALAVDAADEVAVGYDGAYVQHDFAFGLDQVTATVRFFQAPGELERTETYEPELVLARHRFETYDLARRTTTLGESARDALIATHEVEVVELDETVTDHTYSYDGPPHTGTRTQTRDDGVEEVFEYDAQGRLVSSTSGPQLEYDGDLLVRVGLVVYEHDGFGNLLRRIDGDNVTTYDYACWE